MPIPGVVSARRATGEPDYEHPIVAERERAAGRSDGRRAAGLSPTTQRDQPGGFTAEPDVFDTWFTSSLTPQIGSGWELDPERHRSLFPADIRPQSHEIIRTWAFYTIAKALLHEGTVPWKHVVVSGWILDPDRKKMSKSKGNVVTPMHLLDAYGADGVRYWAAARGSAPTPRSTRRCFKVGKRLVTKLFNAGKFVLGSRTGDVAADRRTSSTARSSQRLRALVERATRSRTRVRVRARACRRPRRSSGATSPTRTSSW